MKNILKKLTPFISIIFFCAALWFLNTKLQEYDLSAIAGQLQQIPNLHILLSLVLCVLSYLLLTAYDGLGVTYIGEKLEAPKVIRGGYVGYAFSHNMGLALITGGSIRYRIYSAWGFTGMQVTQIVAFSAFTLWIGFCVVAGLSLLFATPDLPADVVVPFVSLRVLGGILIVLVSAYLWASAKFKEQLSFKNWSFTFPNLTLAVKQVVIASLDWLLAASVLYVLLPSIGINFFSFVGVFLLAQILGLFSQVPGGLGVFESVLLVYLSNYMAGPEILSILVVYRIIYYILPLLGSLVVLGYHEYQVNRHRVESFKDKAAHWIPRIIPNVMSFLVFIGGAILLFSGAVPSDMPRIRWLQHIVPLPVIGMSHFFASLVGAALLVLAHGLQRRIDGAYHLTIGLLVFGILFSLLRGVGYEEAIYLGTMLAALIPCRNEFHREASLLRQTFSARWITLTLMVLISAVWLGIFSYSNMAYSKELWWKFLFTDAPRYLRATVTALGFAVVIGLIKLLRPHPQQNTEPDEADFETSKGILEQYKTPLANLALLKNKELMISPQKQSFMMYAAEGQNLITLGDPVGPKENAEDMIWQFYDYSINKGWNPVFYLTTPQYLDYYIDLGLTMFKLGEQASVDIAAFNAENDVDPEIYGHYNQLAEAGYQFEILSGSELRKHHDRLQYISNACLTSQKRDDQGFTVGQFDREYLSYFKIAVVKKEGRICAFSNILEGEQDGKKEISTDLFRYLPEVEHKVVDYMLLNIMQWGRDEGFEVFNLGMAPLAGMESHDWSPAWSRFANLIYEYGEQFYGFKKVRAYKEKFNPRWEPRYLVCPGGMAIPRIISSLRNIISGGFSKLLIKTDQKESTLSD